VPRWQNNSSVVLGLAMGLIAHLVGLDVSRHFAFCGEFDADGCVVSPITPSEAALRTMVAGGVKTLIEGLVPPICSSSQAVVYPKGLTVRHVTGIDQVLEIVWPLQPPTSF
jgi:hypothetical protein